MPSNSDAPVRVLVVGESWIKHTLHLKGFDQFHTTEYEEGAQVFLDALGASGIHVTYIRAHEISDAFPSNAEDLRRFDVVVISDVGSNSFLLTNETFLRSERTVNRLTLLADFVRAGGGLVMVGGYLSFTGIDGKARFKMSPLAAVLPVTMLDHDDRVEVPEGLHATVETPGHPVLGGAPAQWPILLGYNKIIPKSEATVVARHGHDPILVIGEAGVGRAVAFASDLAPHWAPPEFLCWEHYRGLWSGIVHWAAGRDASPFATPPAHATAGVD